MILCTDEVCYEHDPGPHPERPARITAILRHLRETRPALVAGARAFPPARTRDLARAHDERLLAVVQAACAAAPAALDPDTIVSARSFDAALAAAGQVMGAARAVLAGEGGERRAFAIVRPPGHHATRRRAMGFCLVNNVAVAARVAQEVGASRVAILDFDVHHGNGTQDIFWEDPSVFYVSLHRYPFYPGTGAADERGAGLGYGTTLNFPLPYSTTRAEYFGALARALEAIGEFRPDLLLVSAGFDAYRDDPIGGLHLEIEDFRLIGQAVRATADSLCAGRVASALEGGYHLAMLGPCVEAYLDGLEPVAPG